MVSDKARSLRAHKQLATGLFLLMVAVFAFTLWLGKSRPDAWIGYLNAFAEAAMVGALADWFAVTALFHHPLGLPIPHTNLIERGKKRIGSNLGDFVVTNFLTAGTIRPYISRLTVSAQAADWLRRDKSKSLIVSEVSRLLGDILQKSDDARVARFLARKGGNLLADMKLNTVVASALQFFLEKGEAGKLTTLLAAKVKGFIAENGDLVREKVKAESYFFIPGFVDKKLAAKITSGLVNYFEEIELDPAHRVRGEINAQLAIFIQQLRTEERWETEFRALSANLLSPEKLQSYAASAWATLKETLLTELKSPDSAFARYLHKTIAELAESLQHDPSLQEKIDRWIRLNAYRYILRNARQVGTLISSTVGNWQGRELSQKLELEVGKDLQFIRINGTLVGGLVGLVIYAVTRWIG